jgi:hypothetical protein
MTTTALQSTTTSPPKPTTRVRTGLALSILVALTNFPFLLIDIDWGTTPPPKWLLGLQAAFGLVSIVAAAIAWRTGSRMAIRVDAAFLIVVGLATVPGFFVVGLTAGLKVVTSAIVLATVLAVVLMMGRDRSPISIEG